jgi:hypothetical protein
MADKCNAAHRGVNSGSGSNRQPADRNVGDTAGKKACATAKFQALVFGVKPSLK